MRRLELIALDNIPMIEPDDNLGLIISHALIQKSLECRADDVLVVAQKIVSKAENRYRFLGEVQVSAQAQELADLTQKDPRLVQLILDESVEVVRHRPGAIIVEHKLGFVHANAGIDQSNISQSQDNPRVLLLPENPDLSASRLQASITGNPAIIINDSAGRAWRNGIIGFAIGTAGFAPLIDRIGTPDLYGKPLEVTQVAVADELAAAASFLMGQGNESIPAVLIRGANLESAQEGSSSLIRPKSQDLFR